MADGLLGSRKTTAATSQGDPWARDGDPERGGPRCLWLERSGHGFGFTLRHFIVYPPESFAVWRALGSPRAVDPAQPMDTIFVKRVHGGSPASLAGLSTGDRIVGVNGRPVAGCPYAHVVQLIQQTEARLRLVVVPQEDDVLQIYFRETAHNPETNQRPGRGLRSPEKAASALPVPVHRLHPAKAPKQQQQPHSVEGARGGRLSLAGGGHPRHQAAAAPPRRSSDPLRRGAAAGARRGPHGLEDEDGVDDDWDDPGRRLGPTRKEMARRPPYALAPTDSDMSDSSSSLYYQSGSSADASRRESTASLPSRDGGPTTDGGSPDSASTLTLTAGAGGDDSLIMRRLRKSFEQKEEFLRRPNQPILYNLSPESAAAPASPTPPIREFYARPPQRLQRPVWPPPGSPSPPPQRGSAAGEKPANRSLRRVRSELDSDRELARQQQQPTAAQPGRHFPAALSRIHEGASASPTSPCGGDEDEGAAAHPAHESLPRPSPTTAADDDAGGGRYAEQVQLVSRRARQFECGAADEAGAGDAARTELYRSELARLTARRGAPDVALRTREFERRAGAEPRPPRHRRHDSGSSTDGPATTGGVGAYPSGNRTVPVGAGNVHCTPPRDFSPDDVRDGDRGRARSNSAESWAAAFSASPAGAPLEWPPEGGPSRHRAVRQDSYLAACRTPLTPEPRAPRLLKRQGAALDGGEAPPAPARPTLLELPPDPGVEPAPVTHADLGSLISALDRASASAAGGDIPVVVRRQKATTGQQSQGNDDERLRRASYLRATCAERMMVDGDTEVGDPTDRHRHARSGGAGGHRRWRPPVFPEDVRQLREIFEEASSRSAPALREDPAAEEGEGESPTAPARDGDGDADAEGEGKENGTATAAREGWLHCKVTVVDGKRASDRSWRQVWAVLADGSLTLHKDRREQQQQQQQALQQQQQQQQASSAPAAGAAGPGAGESESVGVGHAQVERADDYTKRKHVLRVNTLSCSELLLQAADSHDMAGWLDALALAAREDCSGLKSPPGGPRLSPLAGGKGIRKLGTFRTRSPTGQSPVNKNLKPSHAESVPGPASSPKTKTWKGRVARQLRRIQHGANSPTAPSYPEGATVGVPLQHCPGSADNEFVPLLVSRCAAVVEERGLDVIGIYRVPGNTAAISSLTEAVNKGFQFNSFQDPRWCEVNVISSLLKLFFRRLPDSLLTSELYPFFIDADKTEDPAGRLTALKRLVLELPDHHYETLKFLVAHLGRVVAHSAANKMEARNLAIVFGPTLVRTADNNMATMVRDMSHQCRIVESLLLYSEWFFSEEDGGDPPGGPPSGGAASEPPELEPSAINHNQSLLLSNIHKVEGMRSDSPSSGKDILAKVIGSSIISAANRKIQKTRGRGVRPGVADGGSPSPSPSPAGVAEPGAADRQETSMEEATAAASRPEGASSEGSEQPPPQQRRGFHFPVDLPEDGTIRTYAGLSATTQERIRRFEQETKAMLQRDPTRQRDSTHLQTAEPAPDPPRRVPDPKAGFAPSEASPVAAPPTRVRENPMAEERLPLDGPAKKLLLSGTPAAGNSVTHVALDGPPAFHGAEQQAQGGRATKKHHGARDGEDGAAPERCGTGQAEHAAPALQERTAANGTLKRLKTGREQQVAQPSQLLQSLRCGSLDSLHEVFAGPDRPASGNVSDEGRRRPVEVRAASGASCLTSTSTTTISSISSSMSISNSSSSSSSSASGQRHRHTSTTVMSTTVVGTARR